MEKKQSERVRMNYGIRQRKVIVNYNKVIEISLLDERFYFSVRVIDHIKEGTLSYEKGAFYLFNS